MEVTYSEWCEGKLRASAAEDAVPHGALHPRLFPFQKQVTEWALRLGRAAIFAECGLGKTAMQLEWARHVAAHTGRRVLIIAPLAVASQTIREAASMDLPVEFVRTAAEVDAAAARVVITNYERLDAVPVEAFGGVVLDESSILKSFMGRTKTELVRRCASVRYRLACTATPAPNDHLELGNHAEFLGVLQSHEMIARWFINDTSAFGVYRLKGHAIEPYWDWVASWAVCIALPSDIGHDDDGYVLPALDLLSHWVEVDTTQDTGGLLFRSPEMSASQIHKEKRRTVHARAAEVARLVAAEPGEQWVVWCETDYEADALTDAIPDAVEVRGSNSLERKERAALDFGDGKIRVLVTKAAIFGWGLNWQHVARVAFVGATFSYEAFYQAIRRCWRFGQPSTVDVHVVMAHTEASVWKILSDKRDAHDSMREHMSAAMRRAQSRSSAHRAYEASLRMNVPAWLAREERAA